MLSCLYHTQGAATSLGMSGPAVVNNCGADSAAVASAPTTVASIGVSTVSGPAAVGQLTNGKQFIATNPNSQTGVC